MKDLILASTSLDPDFAGNSTDCFVGDVRSSSITCWMTSAIDFLLFTKLLSCRHLVFDCNTWLYSCFVLAHDRTSQVMCSGSGSAAADVGFVTKQANSIRGSAFLCCCTICNCKKLPYTMCHCCIALRLFGICIVDANKVATKNLYSRSISQNGLRTPIYMHGVIPDFGDSEYL